MPWHSASIFASHFRCLHELLFNLLGPCSTLFGLPSSAFPSPVSTLKIPLHNWFLAFSLTRLWLHHLNTYNSTCFHIHLRLRSHGSIFKFICFCRYPAPVNTAPFLYKNEEKNIRFCEFTLLTKTDKNLSVSVIYDRSHYSGFVKLHKGAEALTLISALKLIVANSSIRKTGKLNVFHLIGFCFLQLQRWIWREMCKYFIVAIAAFCFYTFLCVHTNPQRFQNPPFLWISILKGVFENFHVCAFLCGVV